MTGKIYHPEQKHPDEYQQDLNPEASAGLNHGLDGPEPEARTAFDMKHMHEQLVDFTADELKEITILQAGSRLETGAVYLNLKNPRPQEIKALGNEDVAEGDLIVAKKDTPYELWNRLLNIHNAARTKKG